MANDAQIRGGRMKYPFQEQSVAAAFEAFNAEERAALLDLRVLIFDVAAQNPKIGELIETLKWGQPAYLPKKPKIGTTVRVGTPKTGGFGLYTHCQTSLMGDFSMQHGAELKFDGNRGVLFESGADIPEEAMRILIERALTYHLTSNCISLPG